MPAATLLAAAAAGQEQANGALAGVCADLRQRQAAHAERHRPLGPQCRLLARKFLNTTVVQGLAALAPCGSTALVLNDGTCPGEEPAAAEQRRARHRRWRFVAPRLLLAAGAVALVPLVVAVALMPARLPRPRGGVHRIPSANLLNS